MSEEEMERRFEGLERSIKMLLALVLVSLSCSLAALAIVDVVLLTT
jgi:hypothetical protein